jgi:hypothetical protein
VPFRRNQFGLKGSASSHRNPSRKMLLGRHGWTGFYGIAEALRKLIHSVADATHDQAKAVMVMVIDEAPWDYALRTG